MDLVLLILCVVVAVIVMIILAFFWSLNSRGQIEELTRRLDQLSSEVNRLRAEAERDRASERSAKAPVVFSAPRPPATPPVVVDAPVAALEKTAAPVSDDAEKASASEAAAVASEAPADSQATELPPSGDTRPEVLWDMPHFEADEWLDASANEPAPGEETPGPAREDAAKPEPIAEPTGAAVAAATGTDVEAAKADWEARIGKRWLTWGGVLLLVAAAGFLVKYAYDVGWIGPWTQVCLGAAAGCFLCGLGHWQIVRKKMRPLGQGIMALGLTLVYLTCFGAFAFFKLEAASQMTTLVLLAVTSTAGVLLSNHHRSLPVCILSALGGYLAPLLVSTGLPPPVNGLFTYTLLVNLGIIAVSMLRSWPALPPLPLLAFAGTIAHFGGWYYKFYLPEQSTTVAAWAAIFHFTFLLLPALPLIRGRNMTPWQWLLPIANAVLAVYVLWTHLIAQHPLALMIVLAAMALAHIAIGAKNRSAVDGVAARGVYSLVGLALLTLSPLAWLGVGAVLACWLTLGVLLIEAGCRFEFKPYRAFGYGNLALGLGWAVHKLWTSVTYDPPFVQFLACGLKPVNPRHIGNITPSLEDFLASLFSAERFWTRLLVPVAFALAALVLHRRRDKDAGGFLILRTLFGVLAVLLALIFVSNDLNPWTFFNSPELDKPYSVSSALAPLWSLGMLGVAIAGWRRKYRELGWISLLFLLPAAALAVRLHFAGDLPGGAYFLNLGFFAKVFFGVACMAVGWIIGGNQRAVFAGVAGYLLVLAIHSEAWSCAGQGRPWLWSVIWNAGSAVYPLIAWRSGNRGLGHCYWFPFLLAAVFAGLGMGDNLFKAQPDARAFLNANYLAAVLVAASLFLKSALPGRPRLESAIAAGWLLLAATNVEFHAWFQADGESAGTDYHRAAAVALMWSLGAAAYALLFWRFRNVRLRWGAAGPIVAALVYMVLAFEARVHFAQPLPFRNLFFVDGVLLAAVVSILALGSDRLRVWLGILGGYALLVVLHLEIGYWHGPWSEYAGRTARTAWYTALWAAGALAYLAASVRYSRKRIYFASLRILSVALFCAGWQYIQRDRTDYMLFLNARFLTTALSLATLAVACRLASLHTAREGGGFIRIPRKYLDGMYIVAAAAGLVVFTLECHYWSIAAWGDDPAGRRVAKMSVSIAWAVYSIFLLVTGFATRVRGWRLGGLVLFGATCLKLVAFDLSHLEQIHRIFAFMAVGLLLMAASYLYHKLERRLKDKDE